MQRIKALIAKQKTDAVVVEYVDAKDVTKYNIFFRIGQETHTQCNTRMSAKSFICLQNHLSTFALDFRIGSVANRKTIKHEAVVSFLTKYPKTRFLGVKSNEDIKYPKLATSDLNARIGALLDLNKKTANRRR